MPILETIANEIQRELPGTVAGFNLEVSEVDEVGQNAAVRIMSSLEKDARLSERLEDSLVCAAYVRTTIRNTACTLLRKKICSRARQTRLTSDLCARFDCPEVCLEIDELREVIGRVRDRCSERSRFAFDVLSGNTSIEDVARQQNRSRSTVQKWFAQGTKALRRTAVRVLSEAYGNEAVEAYLRTVTRSSSGFRKKCRTCEGPANKEQQRMCQELKWMRRGIKKYRVRHGELGYRKAMGNLSDLGREIVCAIEQGRPFDDLIAEIAKNKYFRGRGEDPAPADIKPARVEFVREIAEVRRAFDMEN